MLKIERLMSINGIILMVFQNCPESWLFAILGRDGQIYMDGKRFDSVAAAEQEGRSWVKELSVNVL